MAITLVSGKVGTVPKEWNIYIQDSLPAALTTFKGTPTEANASTAIAAMTEIGEIRTDSFDYSVENGATVEGNKSGEIVLDKIGQLVAESINLTKANMDALAGADGLTVWILCQEKNFHETTKRSYILIENITLNYTEKITGKDIPRGTVTVKKSVPSIADFRTMIETTS